MRALLASPLGFIVGLALGTLGGGGSILAVPLLVYVAGQNPQAATSTSLVLVATTALVGVVPHWRAGRVHLGAGVAFGFAGVIGSVLGTRANAAVDGDVLLLAFGFVMLAAAWSMDQRARSAATGTDGGAVATAVRVDAGTVVRIALAGTVVGLMTGFFGVGGGFVIVPALVLVLRFPMPDAVGTSLVVIAINAFVALAPRLDTGVIDWKVALPFTASSLVGVVVGSHLAGRIDPTRLQRVFAAVLVAIAAFTIVQSTIALAT